MLLFALAMLGMSAYKTYRFCIKYTLRDYLAAKRRRKYLTQASESDEQALDQAANDISAAQMAKAMKQQQEYEKQREI